MKAAFQMAAFFLRRRAALTEIEGARHFEQIAVANIAHQSGSECYNQRDAAESCGTIVRRTTWNAETYWLLESRE
jgi:hypothetical protein